MEGGVGVAEELPVLNEAGHGVSIPALLQADCGDNRNPGLVFGFIGIATIAVGLLGLGSRFNPLRKGLLGGGVGLVLAGVGFGAGGSDDWLTFVTSGLALLTLLGSAA